MINVYKYIEETFNHVPKGYCAYGSEIEQIYKENSGLLYDCIVDAWKLGFEKAYRAAKAGKLDFQQQQ